MEPVSRRRRAKNTATSALGGIANQVGAATQGAFEAMASSPYLVEELITSIPPHLVLEGAKAVGGALVNGAGSAAEAVGEVLPELLEGAGDVAGPLAEGAGDVIGALADGLSDIDIST